MYLRFPLSLSQKGLIVVAGPLILQLVFVAVLIFLLWQAEHDLREETRARAIISEVQSLTKLYYDAGSALFVYCATRSPAYRERYDLALHRIPEQEKELGAVVADEPELSATVGKIKATGKRILSLFHQVRQPFDDGRPVSVQHSRQLQRQGEILLSEMVLQQKELVRRSSGIIASSSPAAAQSRRNVVFFLCLAVTTSVAVTLALGAFFARSIMSRLAVLSDNAKRLAQQEPLNAPLLEEDEISDLDRVFHEMTNALKLAQAKEKALVENARDVICSLDSSGRFLIVSPAVQTMLGYSPLELLGKSLNDVVLSEEQDRTSSAIQQVMTEKGSGSFESRIRKMDGTVIDVLWSAVWSEREEALFSVLHDITELRDADRLKQEVMEMVSHDLRIPLTSIKSVLELLDIGALGSISDEARRRIKSADQATGSLMKLVNDLLDFEKIQSGRLELFLEGVPLEEVVTESVEAVRELAKQAEVRLVVAPVALTVIIDRDRFIQVLVNLLSNAVKFSPAGGTVSLSVEEEPGYFVVTVTDNGCGIARELQEVVFERFRQAMPADGRRRSGTGLGLPICRSIVKLHGGEILLDSCPGRGSKFAVRIPMTLGAVEIDGDSKGVSRKEGQK